MLVALNIYDKLPFGKYHKGHPLIIDMSRKMGRSPSSLAMKLSNFASLDPFHAARGVHGLPKVTKGDVAFWQAYRSEHDSLALEGEALFMSLCGDDGVLAVSPGHKPRITTEYAGPTEKYQPQKVRIGQRFFRQAVLNAYGGRCAVTGLSVRDLLVASHIIPWSEAAGHRLDPRNGIALNALHDRAFDLHLITFDADLKLLCAPSLKDHYTEPAIAQHFQAYEGHPLRVPAEAMGPKPEYLAHHRRLFFG